MNRRTFFRRAFAAAVGAAVAPTVIPKVLAAVQAPVYTFTMTTSRITATPRKLKCTWSEEADQNLQAMYNIKAEKVLVEALRRCV